MPDRRVPKSNRSLISAGTPCSGPTSTPFATAARQLGSSPRLVEPPVDDGLPLLDALDEGVDRSEADRLGITLVATPTYAS